MLGLSGEKPLPVRKPLRMDCFDTHQLRMIASTAGAESLCNNDRASLLNVVEHQVQAANRKAWQVKDAKVRLNPTSLAMNAIPFQLSLNFSTICCVDGLSGPYVWCPGLLQWPSMAVWGRPYQRVL